MEDYIKINQELWNNWTKIHSKSNFYNVSGFKHGETSLRKVELAELTDVTNKTMLHLQCHFGLDSLSWARKGAQVTAVDLSPEAIKVANQLSNELKIPVNFICANIYTLPNLLNHKFDLVYTSYGVLGWLHDLKKWAKIISHFLKPGGKFYMVEFHPFINMFLNDWKEIRDSYFHNRQPIVEEQKGSYIDRTIDFSHLSYIWPYTLEEILCALCEANLKLNFFHEFPYSVYDCFPDLKQTAPGEYTIKDDAYQLPLMFSLEAIKI